MFDGFGFVNKEKNMSDFELNFQERESEVDFITLDVKDRLREIISNRRKMHNILEVGKRVCPDN